MGIVKTPAQVAARAMLIENIKRELRRKDVTRSSELIGYWLSGISMSERYNPPETESMSRKLTAPEFLTGLVSNTKI